MHVTLEQKIEEIGWPALEELVSEKIRELAREQPDFRYREPDDFGEEPNSGQGCSYQYDYYGNPGGGCIIGQAFYRAGVCVQDFEKMAAIDDLIWNRIKQDVLEWWASVQYSQDSGDPWGKCVAPYMGDLPCS